MHAQPNDRVCTKEAIGGNHFGPVMVYMSKVTSAASDPGSANWFKISEEGYNPSTKKWGTVSLSLSTSSLVSSSLTPRSHLASTLSISRPYSGPILPGRISESWHIKRALKNDYSQLIKQDSLNSNCGKRVVTVPASLAPGDYLVRAEAIALHAASSVGGAQFYMTCYQVTVTGSGTVNPPGVKFPVCFSFATLSLFSWLVGLVRGEGAKDRKIER